MICKISGEQYEVTSTGRRICEKLRLPLPQISPAESFRRLIAQRNFFNLYRSACSGTGKSIITNLPPGSPYKVYDKDVWFGDSWDGLEFGRPLSLSRSFFAQLEELLHEVPVFNLQNTNTENCDYCNSIGNAKDCYLAFVCYRGCFDIYYSFRSFASHDIYFCINSDESQFNYYCSRIKRCYGNVCCEQCSNTTDSAFCFALDNCQDCLFSTNLRNRQYCIFNEQRSRADYHSFRDDLNLGSSRALQSAMQKFEEIKRAAVWRASVQVNCEDCVGSQLSESSRCNNIYDAWRTELVDDAIQITDSSEGYRTFGMGKCELFYESTGHTSVTNSSFSTVAWDSYDCHYCTHVQNCKHCFGCVGLRNKSYCILNRQYSPEEYQALRESLIDSMQKTSMEDPSFQISTTEFGQFPPVRFSYFPYNISLAQMLWPLSKEQAVQRGYRWLDDDGSETEQDRTSAVEPPDLINDWRIEPGRSRMLCPLTGKVYTHPPRLIKHFQQQNLALLPQHPLEYLKSKAGRISYRLLKRESAKSGAELLTVYPPEEAPTVWTNAEYKAEFV